MNAIPEEVHRSREEVNGQEGGQEGCLQEARQEVSPYFKRLLEQTVLTFLAAFLPLVNLSDLSSLKSAALAGGAAVLTFAYGVVAKRIGDTERPSIL